MSGVQKTTVYLGDDDYRQLKAIARRLGRRPAELVREAVAEFARTHGARRKARSVGSGRSGRGDISERAEELLSGLSRDR